MGSNQGEEPLLREECIGPADMIRMKAPEPRPLFPLAQQRPQAAAGEAIQLSEHRFVRVLEVPKPASQDRIDLLDDLQGGSVIRLASVGFTARYPGAGRGPGGMTDHGLRAALCYSSAPPIKPLY